jgi:hypothetical protein
MSIEQRLLNLYNQYRDGLVGTNTVIATFDAIIRGEEYVAYYEENRGKWQCYNEEHCCSQCCDCEWDEKGQPL